VYCNAANKSAAIDTLCEKHGLQLDQVAFIGDDLNDLSALECVGLACAVADAADPVQNIAHYVTKRRGGDGAVREVCELLIAAKR
jgi:YrbI family 3-deoxy-D-manno-octulosonate 8-phosphate phosphatase